MYVHTVIINKLEITLIGVNKYVYLFIMIYLLYSIRDPIKQEVVTECDTDQLIHISYHIIHMGYISYLTYGFAVFVVSFPISPLPFY